MHHRALFVVSFRLVPSRRHRRLPMILEGFEIPPDCPIQLAHLDFPMVAHYYQAEGLETSFRAGNT